MRFWTTSVWILKVGVCVTSYSTGMSFPQTHCPASHQGQMLESYASRHISMICWYQSFYIYIYIYITGSRRVGGFQHVLILLIADWRLAKREGMWFWKGLICRHDHRFFFLTGMGWSGIQQGWAPTSYNMGWNNSYKWLYWLTVVTTFITTTYRSYNSIFVTIRG